MSIFRKKTDTRELPRRRQIDSEHPSTLAQQSAHFMRNRTLTGSASSHVASANEAQGTLKSSRVQAHELVNQRRRLSGILLIILLAAAVVAILITQLTANVTVSVGLSRPVDTSLYERTIQGYLTDHPFERLRFALNLANLTEYLRQKLPEVDTVTDVTADGFGSSHVVLRLRTPIVSWKMGDKQYYVDANGVSFARNYSTPPAVQIVDESGVQLAAGSAVASNSFLSYVGRTVALAAQSHLTVEKVVIPLGTTREIELHIKGYSYPVRLSIDRPVGEQVEDMVRAMNYFTQKGETPQYIDVRVGGKAYYR